MRRWFHERFNRHTWREVTHRHADGDHDGPVVYALEECACGALRELEYTFTELFQILPGLTVGSGALQVTPLADIADAKAWSKS